MTRDEAIKIQKRHTPTNVVDILADLGILKLDEPMTAFRALKEDGYGPIAAENILGCLDRANLKIIEK